MVVFKSNIYKRIMSGIGAMFFGSIFGFVVLYFIGRLLEHEYSASVLSDGVLVGVVIGIIYAVFFKRTTVLVYDDKLIYQSGNKAPLEFGYQRFGFSSFVTHHYINGIPSGNTYDLNVLQENGSTRYQCASFNKKRFTEMMATITEKTRKFHYQADPAQESELGSGDTGVRTDGGHVAYTLVIDKDELRAGRNKAIKIAGIVGLVIVVFVFIVLNLVQGSSLEIALVSSVLIGGFVFLLAAASLYFAPNLKKIPNRIVVTDTSITIDETYYDIQDIEKIAMTPPKYSTGSTGNMRTFKITRNHRTETYQMGVRAGKRGFISDYDELVDAIDRTMAKTAHPYIYDI